MRLSACVMLLLLTAAVVSGCGYALPPPLQGRVDTIAQQTEGLYHLIAGAKQRVHDGEINSGTLKNVEIRYNELVDAHDAWRDQVKRIITREMQDFESDDQYQNTIARLENASRQFEVAADAASTRRPPASVPDWAVEARELITLAYDERKMRKAAEAIHVQLRLKRWAEI